MKAEARLSKEMAGRQTKGLRRKTKDKKKGLKGGRLERRTKAGNRGHEASAASSKRSKQRGKKWDKQ